MIVISISITANSTSINIRSEVTVVLCNSRYDVKGEDSDDEAETDEAAAVSAEGWEPDPIDADPRRAARSRRMHDIISMLVGIYGSKELFITEYRCFPLLLRL